jgi:hypothetical protein
MSFQELLLEDVTRIADERSRDYFARRIAAAQDRYGQSWKQEFFNNFHNLFPCDRGYRRFKDYPPLMPVQAEIDKIVVELGYSMRDVEKKIYDYSFRERTDETSELLLQVYARLLQRGFSPKAIIF